jgi:ribosomal protein S18 acetylase RimI-like enzyme
MSATKKAIDVNIRNATADDAKHLAVLINMAGEELPQSLWRQMTEEGQEALDVGAARAAREEGSFSYRNAWVAEINEQIAGMILAYLLPDDYDLCELDSYPAVVRPLVELEAMAPGSWYINAIATYEEFRGQGIASALLSACEAHARTARTNRLSLIVASENEGAHALYLKLGYRQLASRPLIGYPGGPDGGEWLLMIRKLD